jgi:hypothetical protein
MSRIRLKNWKQWTASFFATLGVLVLMTKLKDYSFPLILKVEFAANQAVFHDLIWGNGESLAAQLIRNTRLDFIFITAYSLLFLFTFKLVLELTETKSRLVYLLLAFIPGILDVIENLFLLHMAGHPDGISKLGFWLYKSVVTLKWTLCIPGILMVVVILLHQFLTRLAKVINWLLIKKTN